MLNTIHGWTSNHTETKNSSLESLKYWHAAGDQMCSASYACPVRNWHCTCRSSQVQQSDVPHQRVQHSLHVFRTSSRQRLQSFVPCVESGCLTPWIQTPTKELFTPWSLAKLFTDPQKTYLKKNCAQRKIKKNVGTSCRALILQVGCFRSTGSPRCKVAHQQMREFLNNRLVLFRSFFGSYDVFRIEWWQLRSGRRRVLRSPRPCKLGL